MLAAGCGDGTLRLWSVSEVNTDASRANVIKLSGPLGSAESLSFSPDNKRLGAAGLNGVWLWDIGEPIYPTPASRP